MANDVRLIADLTIPDGTIVKPSSSFVKAWRVENSGDEAWGDGYHLVFIGGEPMAERLGHPLPPTPAGEQADLTLVLTAPEAPDTYAGQWRLQNARGAFFGAPLLVRVVATHAPPPEPEPVGVSNGRFRADLTIPDGTRLAPGASFVKSWEVENTGQTSWSARFRLVHVSGEPMTAETSQPLPAAAPGARVALSLPLTAPAGSGRFVSHWQLQDPRGAPFGEILFLDVTIAAPAAGVRPFEPARWRPTIWGITSVFESGSTEGDPAAFQNSDAGVISYGRHQATLQSGTLHSVLQAYFRRSGSAASQGLQQAYAARIEQRDASLRHDARLKELLLAAAAEPAMAEAQDEVFDRGFYQPAIQQATRRNLSTPLGLACLYDTQIQGGLQTLLPLADARAGGSVGAAGAGGPVTEAAWIAAFLDEREARLLRLADSAEARNDVATARALRISTFRVTAYRTLLAANNVWLEGDLEIRGRRVPGIRFDA